MTTTPDTPADPDGLEGRILHEIARLLKLPDDRLATSASLAGDLGVDSLAYLTLIVGLETHFDVEIPDSQAARFTSVSDVITVFRDCVRRRRAGDDR